MRTVLLAFVVLLTAGRAFGQAPDLDRARRHFEAGSQAYAQRDYPRAEMEFRVAYAITKDPLLYYNIAQAQQHRGHIDEAIKSYKQYLAGVPDAEDRADVERTIRNLETRGTAPPPPVTKPEPRSAPPPTKPKPEPEPPTPPSGGETGGRRTGAWVSAGVSVALLAIGVAMSGISSAKANEADSLIERRLPSGRPLRYTDIAAPFNGYKDDAKMYGGVAIGMYIAAAVGAGLTTYLFLTSTPSTKERSEARLRLMPELSPRSAGLVAGMEF